MQIVKSKSGEALVVATSEACASTRGRAIPPADPVAPEVVAATVVGRGSNLRVAMAYLEEDCILRLATRLDLCA